jgi:hypothetical protein
MTRVREGSYTHHVTLDQVQPQGNLLDARLVWIDSALFRVREDDVRLLIEARENALCKFVC